MPHESLLAPGADPGETLGFMSRAARTLYVWALYLGVLGLTLLVAPNVPLRLFGVPDTHEVWLRVVGMFCVFIAALDWVAAREELTIVFRWATYVRYTVPLFFGAFVALDLAAPQLMLFAALDVVAATWTLLALRADARGRA